MNNTYGCVSPCGRFVASSGICFIHWHWLCLIPFSALMPSVLWRCWLGGRKGIWPVKNWSVGCWHGYLSGARCRLAYGHMASWCHCHSLSLASVKSRSVLPFWYRLTWVVPDKEPLNGCVFMLNKWMKSVRFSRPLCILDNYCSARVAFSASTLLAAHQKEHPTWVMRCWCGYLSGARCRSFADGPADATAIPKTHQLLPYLNPDCFYLSGTGLPRLYWERGC